MVLYCIDYLDSICIFNWCCWWSIVNHPAPIIASINVANMVAIREIISSLVCFLRISKLKLCCSHIISRFNSCCFSNSHIEGLSLSDNIRSEAFFLMSLSDIFKIFLSLGNYNVKDELTQKPPNALNLQKNRLGFCGQLNPFVSRFLNINRFLCMPFLDSHIIHVTSYIPHLSYLDILFHHPAPYTVHQ